MTSFLPLPLIQHATLYNIISLPLVLLSSFALCPRYPSSLHPTSITITQRQTDNLTKLNKHFFSFFLIRHFSFTPRPFFSAVDTEASERVGLHYSASGIPTTTTLLYIELCVYPLMLLHGNVTGTHPGFFFFPSSA